MKFDVDNKNRCLLVCVKFYLNRCRFAVAVAKCLEGSLFWEHSACIVTVVAVSVCMSVQCLLYTPWLFWEGGYPPFLSVPFLVAFLSSVPLGSRPPPDVLWCILGTNLHHFGCWTTSWWACLCVCLSAIFGTTLPIFLCVLSIKRMFPWYICITYCPGRKKF